MSTFKVKFFGRTKGSGKGNLIMVKRDVDADDRSKVEEALRKEYDVVNGLKIR